MSWATSPGVNTEAVYREMRKIDEEAQTWNRKTREGLPRQGEIDVGPANFDNFLAGWVRESFLGHLRREASPEAAAEKAKEDARMSVVKHNAQRRDVYWKRWEGAGGPDIDDLMRRIIRAGNEDPALTAQHARNQEVAATMEANWAKFAALLAPIQDASRRKLAWLKRASADPYHHDYDAGDAVDGWGRVGIKLINDIPTEIFDAFNAYAYNTGTLRDAPENRDAQTMIMQAAPTRKAGRHYGYTDADNAAWRAEFEANIANGIRLDWTREVWPALGWPVPGSLTAKVEQVAATLTGKSVGLDIVSAALLPYGASLTGEGFIQKGDKVLGVKAVIKGNRLRMEDKAGTLKASGPITAYTVTDFVEKFWFWEKGAPTPAAAPTQAPSSLAPGAMADQGLLSPEFHVVAGSDLAYRIRGEERLVERTGASWSPADNDSTMRRWIVEGKTGKRGKWTERKKEWRAIRLPRGDGWREAARRFGMLTYIEEEQARVAAEPAKQAAAKAAKKAAEKAAQAIPEATYREERRGMLPVSPVDPRCADVEFADWSYHEQGGAKRIDGDWRGLRLSIVRPAGKNDPLSVTRGAYLGNDGAVLIEGIPRDSLHIAKNHLCRLIKLPETFATEEEEAAPHVEPGSFLPFPSADVITPSGRRLIEEEITRQADEVTRYVGPAAREVIAGPAFSFLRAVAAGVPVLNAYGQGRDAIRTKYEADFQKRGEYEAARTGTVLKRDLDKAKETAIQLIRAGRRQDAAAQGPAHFPRDPRPVPTLREVFQRVTMLRGGVRCRGPGGRFLCSFKCGLVPRKPTKGCGVR